MSFVVYDFRVDLGLLSSASVFKESGNSASGLSVMVLIFFFSILVLNYPHGTHLGQFFF